MVGNLFRYAAGRAPEPGEQAWMAWLNRRFAADGHRFPDLMRRIATSAAFYRVAEPQAGVSAPALQTSEVQK
jgi:hypothetical protein